MNAFFFGLVKNRFRIVMLLAVLAGPFQYAMADLVLSAPPRETDEAGVQLYEPLAARLTELLGEKVSYVRPDNWLAYQRDMRDDKYDIIFDGPHFVSWRIKNKGHNVAIKLPGTLQFVIVARKEDDKVQGLEDLVGKKICGIAPPNLGTLTVYAAYTHPAQQPVVKPIRGGFGKVYKSFESGKCQGAVFRTTFYEKKLTDEQRSITKVLHTSPEMPNQGITLSSRVKPEARKLIIDALAHGNMLPATKNILQRFGGKAKAFMPATNEDYQGYNKLLEGVIFGW